jgi:hypothetical protein
MKTKALVEVLSSNGNCTHKDDTIEIPEGTEVSLYVSLGSETLVVSGLATIQLMDEMLLASTRKGEAYAIVSEDLRALRVGAGKTGRRTGLI